MGRRRVLALCFAAGSMCFLLGPLPGYAHLVGGPADAATFFVGSMLFTAGGALQSVGAWPARRRPGGRAAWWAAIVQSAGTLFFNVSTYQALHTAPASPGYNALVWRPDWRGSICFLVSGVVAYAASPRRWQPTVNLLGCALFGVSAVAGYVVPSTGSMLDAAVANAGTALGAACFLACAAPDAFIAAARLRMRSSARRRTISS